MINVEVDKKTEEHPFFKEGSKMGYTIDGVIGKTLILERGKIYQFNVNTKGHPFYFTNDITGGKDAYGNISYPGYINGQSTPVDIGILNFHVPYDAPSIFYYQCGIHPKMGGFVIIQTN